MCMGAEAFDAGFDAAAAGMPVWRCPFERGSVDERAWMEGWQAYFDEQEDG